MVKRKQILIVDDDASIRKLCQRMLKRLDMEVLQADSGTRALEELESNEDIDAVLLDINLPDGMGTDWAEKIHQARPSTSVIYFTGASWAELAAGDPAQRTYFLKKPFTRDSIQTVLDQALA